MKEIVFSGLQLPRSHPVHILLLGIVVVGGAEKGKKSHRMPAQGHDIARGDVLLTIIIADGTPEEAAIIGKKEAFVSIKVQPVSTDSGIN